MMATQLLGTVSVSTQSFKFSSALSFSQSQSLSLTIPYSPKFISISASSPPLSLIYCGRGDRKTAKGKRFAHSFGNARPRDRKKGRGPPRMPTPPSPRKKDRFDED